MLAWEQDMVCRSNKIKQSPDTGFVICGTAMSGYCKHTAQIYTPNIIKQYVSQYSCLMPVDYRLTKPIQGLTQCTNYLFKL